MQRVKKHFESFIEVLYFLEKGSLSPKQQNNNAKKKFTKGKIVMGRHCNGQVLESACTCDGSRAGFFRKDAHYSQPKKYYG